MGWGEGHAPRTSLKAAVCVLRRLQGLTAHRAVAGAELVGLQGVEHAQHLVDRAADLEVVDRRPADDAVGVDDEGGSNGSVVFQVYLDGVKKYDSGTMTGASATKFIDLDVTGAKTLRLVVTDAGNGNTFDHADWAGAVLT